MKTIKLLLVIGIVSILGFSSCAPEKDIKNPDFNPLLFSEDFSSNTVDGDNINLVNWKNFAETGTVKWKQGVFYSDKYAEFSGYQSGETSNIGWLISPSINMDTHENEKIVFQIAQAYVSSSANSLTLWVSTDFDGTNVTAANWEQKSFTLPPLNTATNFDFFDSGVVDLSEYTGNVHIAFKVKSSGTNTSLDGTYEIDNVRIFNQKQ
jgi:hypothetical protein